MATPHLLQTGQGGPVVLELDLEESDISRMRELGYEVFTSVDSLRGYVQRRNEEAAGVEEDGERPGEEEAGERERAFTQAMVEVYEIARSIGYNATHLIRMISELGGVETARRLIGSPVMSDGFAALWERGRLDLTVEALALLPMWRTLFTPDELDMARDRLSQFGYRAAG